MMDRDRVSDALATMAQRTIDGIQRMESASQMLTASGDVLAMVARGLAEARFQASVMQEASRLLKEPAPVESP